MTLGSRSRGLSAASLPGWALQFRAATHGAPAPPPLGLFSGWCCSSLQSRGKSGAHVSTSRVSPGTLTLFQQEKKKKKNTKEKKKKPWCSFENPFIFLLAYSSSEAAGFLAVKTRRRSSAPAALTLANVILNDDRVQSANSVSNHLKKIYLGSC